MRRYTNNSPEAAARIVALALMADGAVDRNEILLLKRQNVVTRLGLDNDRFDSIYYEYCTDMLASARMPARISSLFLIEVPSLTLRCFNSSSLALRSSRVR